MPCLINYPNWAGTEYTGFLNQASHHNAMCSQQIIHRIGVKLVQPFVDFIREGVQEILGNKDVQVAEEDLRPKNVYMYWGF